MHTFTISHVRMSTQLICFGCTLMWMRARSTFSWQQFSLPRSAPRAWGCVQPVIVSIAVIYKYKYCIRVIQIAFLFFKFISDQRFSHYFWLEGSENAKKSILTAFLWLPFWLWSLLSKFTNSDSPDSRPHLKSSRRHIILAWILHTKLVYHWGICW